MTILNRPLGGWTRLWIAVTALWLLVVVGGAWLVSGSPWRPYYVVAELGGHLDSALVQRISDSDRFPAATDGDPFAKYVVPQVRAKMPDGSIQMFRTEMETRAAADAMNRGEPAALSGAFDFMGRLVFLDRTHFTTEASLGELRAQLDRAYATERSIRWWSRVRGIVALALLPPIVLFAFGLTVGWVFRGFRPNRSTASGG